MYIAVTRQDMETTVFVCSFWDSLPENIKCADSINEL